LEQWLGVGNVDDGRLRLVAPKRLRPDNGIAVGGRNNKNLGDASRVDSERLASIRYQKLERDELLDRLRKIHDQNTTVL
jgi:hypothetical protein